MRPASLQRPARAVLGRPAAVDLCPDAGGRRSGREPLWWAPYAIAAVAFAAYAAYSIAQYLRIAEPSWDLAIFTQIVQGYAHLHAPVADIRGPHLDALGDHFSPVLAVLAPAYRVFPSPLTLQVAQAALFAVAIVPITRLAMRHLGRRTGVLVGVCYALAWGIQSAVAADFHEVAFAVPLLAFACAALVERRWRAAVLWSAPLVLVKEDLGLTVAAIGVYLVFRGERKLGLLTLVGGAVATAVIIGLVIPAFNPHHTYTYWGMVHTSAAANPVTLVTRLVSPATKLHTVLLLVAITGFAALRSPLLLVGLPTLVWRFESADSRYWGTSWHYSAVLMPIVFAAMVDGLVRLRSSDSPTVRSVVQRLPALALAVSLVLCVQFPLRDLVRPSSYQRLPASATAAVAAVPRGTSVESDVGLLTLLVPHHTVFTIGDTGSTIPEYVAIDTSIEGSAADSPVVFADSLHPGTTYRLVYRQGSYAVLQVAR
ncbi:MAG TPA: DUF2079 domain-containing protein [Mycobacteriales bacterium]|nr:DUF2079 domain-containing protein [Mycobacteriales bacterium]